MRKDEGMTLTEFLEERIAEDEEAARTATSGPWIVDFAGDFGSKAALIECARWQGYVNTINLGDDHATAAHIARQDPARVLAECEAKRRIMELASAIDSDLERLAPPSPHIHIVAGSHLLRALALPFADHPDYREEWKP